VWRCGVEPTACCCRRRSSIAAAASTRAHADEGGQRGSWVAQQRHQVGSSRLAPDCSCGSARRRCCRTQRTSTGSLLLLQVLQQHAGALAVHRCALEATKAGRQQRCLHRGSLLKGAGARLRCRGTVIGASVPLVGRRPPERAPCRALARAVAIEVHGPSTNGLLLLLLLLLAARSCTEAPRPGAVGDASVVIASVVIAAALHITARLP
jgi:hypothetical protein